MQPIFDNVEYLMNLSRSDKKAGRGYHELIDLGILEIEPLTYIRGRSIPNQFMIVDEAQNLTPHEVKTIITRVGDGTKIVLTGDPYQIDNPYVDSDEQRPHPRREPLQGRADRRPHHAVEGRAEPARGAGGEPAVTHLRAANTAVPPERSAACRRGAKSRDVEGERSPLAELAADPLQARSPVRRGPRRRLSLG